MSDLTLIAAAIKRAKTAVAGDKLVQSAVSSLGTAITEAAVVAGNAFTAADETKLDGIETAATADLTGAEIKALYEGEENTNAFDDAEQTALASMETGATGDQTDAEIKAAYENNADTNEFSDAEQTKLAGIETSATADQSNAEIETAYNAQVGIVSQADAEAGSSTTAERWTPERVKQAIAALQTDTLPRLYLSGLYLSNSGGDLLHDITINAGEARDLSHTVDINLTPSITKRIDAAWAVGTGNGGLDGTESVGGTPDASTWYHLWLIMRTDTGVVDVLFSENATSPTMPTNYDKKRRIGAVLTDSSANIIAFTQRGDEFLWLTIIKDYAVANPGNTATSRTLSTPLGVRVLAIHRLSMETDVIAGGMACLISSLDQIDVAPDTDLGTVAIRDTGLKAVDSAVVNMRTYLSSQIRTHLIGADVNTIIRGTTYGWIDARGRDA